jgi:hypothetical protein|tara:strand:- start:117 stop:308 length:192 start_codon:yes stop_codon:yes gene_type:complete
MSKADELKKLKNLFDEGILTEEEYLNEKSKLLNAEGNSDGNILSLLKKIDSDAEIFMRLFEEE